MPTKFRLRTHYSLLETPHTNTLLENFLQCFAITYEALTNCNSEQRPPKF